MSYKCEDHIGNKFNKQDYMHLEQLQIFIISVKIL